MSSHPPPTRHSDGPRGAIILTTDPELAKKIDRAVFPGEQAAHTCIFSGRWRSHSNCPHQGV